MSQLPPGWVLRGSQKGFFPPMGVQKQKHSLQMDNGTTHSGPKHKHTHLFSFTVGLEPGVLVVVQGWETPLTLRKSGFKSPNHQ